jgi:hypothetical protein
VGVEKISLLLQIAHRVTDSGRRYAKVKTASDIPTPGGLGGVHIGAHYGL